MTALDAVDSGGAADTVVDLLRLADPSRDVRDRLAADSGVVDSPDKIWFHKTAAAVIDAGRCVRCGTCIAACPSNSIGLGTDGLPTLVRMCTGCSSCWDFCPLGGMRTERLAWLWSHGQANGATNALAGVAPASVGGPVGDAGDAGDAGDGELGRVLAAYEARARERAPGAQDGGVVTALLVALLGDGYIHGALLSHKHSPLRGETVLATTAEQVRQGAGSVYDQTYPLAKIAQGLPPGVERIALVGTPCQIAGLRALQRFPWQYRSAPVEKVALAIALFCTRSFDPQRLTIELVRRGLDLARTAKVDIRDGTLRAFDAADTTIFETKVRALNPAGLAGCDECADFTGALADIAVGNLGSRRGATTVLIRTARGAEAWERAAAALDAAPLADLTPVATLAARNRKQAVRTARRGFGAHRSLWVSYTEYLTAALGSERAPAVPPPYRSHHYTIAC